MLYIILQKVFDLNNDGKVDEQDIQAGYEKLQSVLTYNMPTGGGFTSGLLIGLKS